MSKSKLINISLAECEVSKFDLGEVDGKVCILYDGKPPCLDIAGVDDDPYLLTSSEGLKKNQEWDTKKLEFIKGTWAGKWNISMLITDNLSKIKPPTEGDDTRAENDKLRYKLVEIAHRLRDLLRENIDDKALEPLSMKAIYETNKFGAKKLVGYDEDSYVYLPVAVNYTADENVPTFKNKEGKDEPQLEYRRPKPKFYDLNRAAGDELLQDPAVDAAVPMRAEPKVVFSINNAPKGKKLAFNLVSLYFQRDDSLKKSGGRAEIDKRRERVTRSKKELFDQIPE